MSVVSIQIIFVLLDGKNALGFRQAPKLLPFDFFILRLDMSPLFLLWGVRIRVLLQIYVDTEEHEKLNNDESFIKLKNNKTYLKEITSVHGKKGGEKGTKNGHTSAL